jgi:Zn-dependent oligopeptidase
MSQFICGFEGRLPFADRVAVVHLMLNLRSLTGALESRVFLRLCRLLVSCRSVAALALAQGFCSEFLAAAQQLQSRYHPQLMGYVLQLQLQRLLPRMTQQVQQEVDRQVQQQQAMAQQGSGGQAQQAQQQHLDALQQLLARLTQLQGFAEAVVATWLQVLPANIQYVQQQMAERVQQLQATVRQECREEAQKQQQQQLVLQLKDLECLLAGLH